MKYVMFDTQHYLMFPNTIAHTEFKSLGNIVSAGFISVNRTVNSIGETRYDAMVWGKSDSLGVESNPDDANFISLTLR